MLAFWQEKYNVYNVYNVRTQCIQCMQFIQRTYMGLANPTHFLILYEAASLDVCPLPEALYCKGPSQTSLQKHRWAVIFPYDGPHGRLF